MSILKVEVICEQCGTSFFPWHRSSRRFCSRPCGYAGRKADFEKRFWENVQKTEGDGCWPWVGGTDAKGYGKVGVIRSDIENSHRAHRVAWVLVNGPIPEGFYVLHHCDNPPCVRPDHPDHLFLGTAQDNVDDMVQKKRHHFGAGSPNAKLTEEQVAEIRKLHNGGASALGLSKQFSISRTQIRRIVDGTVWTPLI